MATRSPRAWLVVATVINCGMGCVVEPIRAALNESIRQLSNLTRNEENLIDKYARPRSF